MQNPPIEARVRSNCNMTNEGVIDLSVGRACLELKVVGDAEYASDAFGFLEFQLLPELALIGATVDLEFRWQGVLIDSARFRIARALDVCLPINGFKAPSLLEIKANILRDDAQYDVEFDAHSLIWGSFSGIKYATSTDELGSRKYLIGSAHHCSQSLGLQGDYMASEKGALLRSQVVGALKSGRPFSAVRLGDGEGRVLGYPDFFSNMEVLSQVLNYHFGPESMGQMKAMFPDTWIQESMEKLRNLLMPAISQADVLGVPIVEYFAASDAAPTSGMLGYACAMSYGLSLSRRLAPAQYVGTNVFQLLAVDGGFFRAATAAAKSVHLVGPWDLRQAMAEAYGIPAPNWIQVPGHYTWRGSRGLGQFPDLYRYIERKIASIESLEGALFLVGAGILGKHYCNIIKARGGVALDVGSVFDAWAQRGRPDAVANKNIRLVSSPIEASPALRDAMNSEPPGPTNTVIPFEVPANPSMDAGGLAVFDERLKVAKVFLEYGAGGSTLLAARSNVQSIYSVESDRGFISSVQEAFALQDSASKLFPIYVNIGATKGWGHPVDNSGAARWPQYCGSVWDKLSADNASPDLVLIDGRFRVACFCATLFSCKPGTLILFDDYGDREYYHEVETVLQPTAMHGRMAEFLVTRDLDVSALAQLLIRHVCDAR